MTLTIATPLGKVRITAPFPIPRKIRQKVRTAFQDDPEIMTLDDMNAFLENLDPEIRSPGARIEAYLGIKNMTQKRLGELTGIPQGHISAMIHNKRPIGLRSARKLAKAFHVDYRNFL